MSQSNPQQDPLDAQTDLLAMLAASRELGPEMDQALVESYVQQHHPAQMGESRALAMRRRLGSPNVIKLVCLCVGLIAYIVLVIATHGWLWWMFWPLMGWTGWWWGYGDHRTGCHARRAKSQHGGQ
jgi:hypothetical protein